MAARECFKPKHVSRKSILETVGEEGRGKFRNPVHLDAVHEGWPHPKTDEAKGMQKTMGLEMTPGYRNGPL